MRTPRAEIDFDDFTKAIDSLLTCKASGLGGLRNEHITALRFNPAGKQSPKADRAIHHFYDLANQIVQGNLPWFFYAGYTAVRLCAINKDDPRTRNEETPMDCRPVGIGNAARRVISQALLQPYKQDFITACSPSQLGCGVKAGSSQLLFSTQVMLEASPSHMVANIDVANAKRG